MQKTPYSNQSADVMDSFLLLTRPGFEADCAAEADTRSSLAGLAGFAKAKADSGYLEWSLTQGALADFPRQSIFAHRMLPIVVPFTELSDTDRVGDLLQLLPAGDCWNGFELCHADTNEGRSLSRFLRGFAPHFERALIKAGRLRAKAATTLCIFFADSRRGFVCLSDDEPVLPRLRLLSEAPSRSALKIEEACLRFFTETQRRQYLRAGMTAVDLGAAPGGWSWYLARQGIKVTGVDHGRLQQALLENYPVVQVSADAYTFRPPRSVDWVVCDVVEKPARTQALMLKWLQQGWATQALFNLKLPMKQRFRSLWPLLEEMRTSLAKQGNYRVEARQLYHDREEVTVLVIPQ